ncbi:TIR domain-containing protein [Mycolicibacillus trivialis]|uniref:TIR domain-containing protein n=1 Tax=Mycolicibacillus trivialis TaxID=1798 RepID=UPI000A1494EB
MAPRVFISFQMEDRWARDFLAQHAKDKRNDIEFIDYSVQNPWDNSWKTQCRERIALTQGTIVLIGSTTYLSEAVLWEIAETSRQKHYMFGIQTRSTHTYTVPSGLRHDEVVRWDFDQIVKRLSTWQ